ncbi:membrane-associated protein, putative [Bodo saltans]|uniref:Membrane-associated protein, putative n=1 Tax=Bodo saltans TaxID=75058 RepID=A0A0S4KH86_BODSA|nr:membrane-associated protein, putative [Bodo saltans]|eukprot:CUI11831.1 membrane-associated protein, putative [Bodo saltans]
MRITATKTLACNLLVASQVRNPAKFGCPRKFPFCVCVCVCVFIFVLLLACCLPFHPVHPFTSPMLLSIITILEKIKRTDVIC